MLHYKMFGNVVDGIFQCWQNLGAEFHHPGIAVFIFKGGEAHHELA
jgi:hypothetical protein